MLMFLFLAIGLFRSSSGRLFFIFLLTKWQNCSFTKQFLPLLLIYFILSPLFVVKQSLFELEQVLVSIRTMDLSIVDFPLFKQCVYPLLLRVRDQRLWNFESSAAHLLRRLGHMFINRTVAIILRE